MALLAGVDTAAAQEALERQGATCGKPSRWRRGNERETEYGGRCQHEALVQGPAHPSGPGDSRRAAGVRGRQDHRRLGPGRPGRPARSRGAEVVSGLPGSGLPGHPRARGRRRRFHGCRPRSRGGDHDHPRQPRDRRAAGDHPDRAGGADHPGHSRGPEGPPEGRPGAGLTTSRGRTSTWSTRGRRTRSTCGRPQSAEIDRWMAEGGPGDRWHVTLAPETEGALEAIRLSGQPRRHRQRGPHRRDVRAMRAAVEAGLSHATHLYNGMRGLHHREPGTVGGAITLPGMTVELIADGVHVHPAAMQVAVRTRGPARVLPGHRRDEGGRHGRRRVQAGRVPGNREGRGGTPAQRLAGGVGADDGPGRAEQRSA